MDLVLRAQASNASAEVAFYTAQVNYNKAITELHMRRGTLLENDGINLVEGEWNAVAQQEAVRRAWARSFAFPAPRLESKPAEFSSPVPYPKTDIYPVASPQAGYPTESEPIYADPTQPTPADEPAPQ